ncbi:hypothetical protein [Shinella sp. BYT-45]|uniref:hypothetical protein n=1 Tax=Shinella sp. BYT-45 TaxID=3377377 RepID=UPI0039816458
MMDIMPEASHALGARHMQGILRTASPAALCLAAALLSTTAFSARAADERRPCDLTPDGLVECPRPARGFDPAPFNREDMPEWLKDGAALDGETKTQER